jgi:transposase
MKLQAEQVWLAVESIDMRMGIDGLSIRVQQTLGKAPCDGSAYGFCNKRGNRLKLLIWDGTGVWLCVRRPHQGRFVWPTGNNAVCTLNQAQWEWLIKGVDWQRLEAQAKADWRT